MSSVWTGSSAQPGNAGGRTGAGACDRSPEPALTGGELLVVRVIPIHNFQSLLSGVVSDRDGRNLSQRESDRVLVAHKQ